jgi:hypothetical protein
MLIAKHLFSKSEVKTMQEGVPNHNELQNNVSVLTDAQASRFCPFSPPQLIYSIFSINTNLSVLTHVPAAFSFRRGNPDVGSK